MMKILILDDDSKRIDAFKRNLIGDVSLTATTTVTDCIQALQNTDYDVAFLDHDLDGHHYVPSDGDEQTGWHVAKWLNENPDRQPKQIFLHSLNAEGRKKMNELLPNALQKPFSWEMVEYEDGEIAVKDIWILESAQQGKEVKKKLILKDDEQECTGCGAIIPLDHTGHDMCYECYWGPNSE